jgi:hypothetical protein
LKQSDYKGERNNLMAVSIVVSVFIATVVVGALIVNVSGLFIFLWLPIVVALTFMYQSLGMLLEEALIRLRATVYGDELKPWSMGVRIDAISAWPLIIMPLVIWYSAKAAFNLNWEGLTEGVEEETPASGPTRSKVQV